jgi:dienelactone hydrolase
MIPPAFWRSDIDPTHEPARVLIERGEIADNDRDGRIVPYKIYYPEQNIPKPLPVIIWSHGLGGTQDGAGFIARFLASHGYIHMNIGHEGTNDSLWRGKPGHPWDNIRKAKIPWSDVINRYKDVPFILDRLENGEIMCPIPMDLSHIGMSGHSFGALTTQIMAGQKTGNPEPLTLKDTRFAAGILYSPVPNNRLQLSNEQVYGDITLSLLHLTGTEDYSPLDGPIQHLRDSIYEYAGTKNNAMQMSVILDGADHMVFNGSRGQLPDYDGMDLHKDQIKIIALSWWDYFLKEDANAGHWLRQNLNNYLGTSSSVSIKNDNGSMI